MEGLTWKTLRGLAGFAERAAETRSQPSRRALLTVLPPGLAAIDPGLANLTIIRNPPTCIAPRHLLPGGTRVVLDFHHLMNGNRLKDFYTALLHDGGDEAGEQ